MESVTASSRTLIIKKLKPNQHLLAVSKKQTLEKIEELYQQGQRDFAENYIQEALTKIESSGHLDISWHLIGPIQKNKVKFLKKNFTYIHSIDSLSLAQLISEKAQKLKHQQKVFIQVNLSGEETKSGFDQATFLQAWPQLQKLAGLQIVGLMTMPPLENEAEKNRKYFHQLKQLAHTCQLKELSMGTSHDYMVALEEGATWIRVGTLLFGERPQTKTSEQEKHG